jgi:CHAT domain-containing protein
MYRLAPERKISADVAEFREAVQRTAFQEDVRRTAFQEDVRRTAFREGAQSNAFQEDVQRTAAFREDVQRAAFSKQSVSTQATEAEWQGRRLYEDLFGSLNARERSKAKWLLSLEGDLFEVPFAALVERSGGQTVYLVERHSIQAVPGALLLSNPERSAPPGGRFLGVGDPVYNAADSRWRAFSPAATARAGSQPSAAGQPAGQLVRLVASGEEVRTSAAIWQRRSGTATVLEGFQAGRETFLEQLARRPRVIHLATHVLFPQGQFPESSREQAFVAFSIPSSARNEGPQYLTTARISTLQVPGALVVMTGCATGTGEASAGAGLLGLTRAWLMAGASGVLATAWPVEDSTGEIFSRFYRYYPQTSAAEALRRSQVEMLRHAAPAQWASYQLTGGLR